LKLIASTIIEFKTELQTNKFDLQVNSCSCSCYYLLLLLLLTFRSCSCSWMSDSEVTYFFVEWDKSP